jgi:hypothetical protein
MRQDIDNKPISGNVFPLSLTIIAGLMILFGLAEVVTGFTHQFFGLTTSEIDWSTYLGVALGLFYFVGGILVLTKVRWAGLIAIALLCGDVCGRIGMVVFGLYPVDSFRQTFGIVAGTTIAAFFAVYIGLKLKSFRQKG